MINSIIKKEWLKIKPYFFALLLAIFASLGYFFFNLNFSFSTIEPESMMWYKFAYFLDKPYYNFLYLYLLISMGVAFSQFLPERINNRIKIIAHLPLSMTKALYYHLFIGILYIFILSFILSAFLTLILSNYYPDIIINVIIKDLTIFSSISIVFYLLLSSLIIEKKPLFVFIKFLLVILLIGIFFKNEFFIEDFLFIILLFVYLPFVALDSFYSIKEQRFYSKFFYIGNAFVISLMLYFNYINYEENYKQSFNKYYLFYSNIANDFVYQKNFGDHRFEYGIKDKKIFDRKTYESLLPFVYWKDLAIQGKLPITINKETFDKNTIKKSRLGFSYKPNMLKKLETPLYPLFNASSTKGILKFPEEMLSIDENSAYVYNFDEGLDKKLSKNLNLTLLEKNFSYPAKYIWGKTTNMKPFDKGYLILDNKNQLFNLKRKDGKISVEKIPYPKDINLVHIRISD